MTVNGNLLQCINNEVRNVVNVISRTILGF